ncbi:hypothetical protein [Mycolicibacterium mengxianglii]|uniref:hypothetical protein n=1 Tax=Mycolicibacterium mengxianglii TaxID=2736649 RepID=UPI001E45C049|nr:hypothetical protein [Mycolicibacterium mengxianglii]
MRSVKNRFLIPAAASASALALFLSGCTPAEEAADSGATSSSSPVPTLPAFTATTTTSTPAEMPTDYSRLLLTAEDISDAEDTFTLRSSTPDADGTPGASAFFVNDEDTRAITDTIVAYADAPAASAALQQVIADPSKVVSGGRSRPLPVGTDGTLIKGTAPDGGKAVTLLVFTEGRALVRLKFESAAGDDTTDPFVTTIGKMQQIALRTGLLDSE